MGPRKRKPWNGGPLRIKKGTIGYQKNDTGAEIPTYTLDDDGTYNAVAYGTGLALVQEHDGAAQHELPNGLWIRVAVRDGQPQLLAIESRATEHPLTVSQVRGFPLDKNVAMVIRSYTVRVSYDSETGEPFGVWADSPTGLGESRSVVERTADVTKVARRSRGRPALPNDFLMEVLERWENEKVQHHAAAAVLASEYSVQESTVRQWVFKARKRKEEMENHD